MLNLKYIICEGLPEWENEYLRRNISDIDEKILYFVGRQVNDDLIYGEQTECAAMWREDKEENLLTCLERQADDCGVKLQEFVENGLYISSDRKCLYHAGKAGMATVCYLPQQTAESNLVDANHVAEDIVDVMPDIYVEGFEEVDAVFLQHVYERHHHIPWTILETKRCIVKEFSMEYLDALFELYRGKGMTDYMEPLYPYEQEKEYQQAYIENMYRFYGYGMWLVCEKETGKLIGRAGVEHREELEGELELGYAIGVEYQRQGYATEVCEAILAYVREELVMPSICCLIQSGNAVSEHLAEKLGFSFACSLEIDNKQMKKYVYVF